jgi:hypothetical protein
MHEIAKPFPAEDAATRIELVNVMSEEVNRDSGNAVRFLPTGSGSGLACFPGVTIYGDELEARCQAQVGKPMNVSTHPRVSLASCNPLPQVQLVTGAPKVQRNAKQADEEVSKKPKPAVKQAIGKPDKTKTQSRRDTKKKSGKRFFLFSRVD